MAGSVVCYFERSALAEHKGKRVVVLRVKRFVDSDPVRPAPIPHRLAHVSLPSEMEARTPREGQLLMTRLRKRICPWAVELDVPGKEATRSSKLKEGLKILFENEALYGSLQETETP